MKLDLNEIALNIGKRIKYVLDEKPIEDMEGVKGVEPIKGEAVFTNTGSTIVVRGNFNTTVELECARCLSCFLMKIDLPIEEELPIAGNTEWEAGEDEEELGLPEEEKEPIFENNIFNLEEVLRQYILVAVPIKPLCSEECKGLCPQCGKNLAEGLCECKVDTVTSPFGALASLLKEEQEN